MYYLNDVLNDLFQGETWTNFKANNFMLTDIEETNDGYILNMNLAGVKKENVNISYDDGVLTISAKLNEETKDKKFVVKERYQGEFKRSFEFDDIDADNVKASLENGILTLNLKKVEIKETKKLIEIM